MVCAMCVYAHVHTRKHSCMCAHMPIHICDRACENQPWEHKLHRIIFSLISLALNVMFISYDRAKKLAIFCARVVDFCTFMVVFYALV